MKEALREQILAYNRAVAANKEKAEDLMTILGALPPGQVKHLMQNAVIGPILRKYGIGGEEGEST